MNSDTAPFGELLVVEDNDLVLNAVERTLSYAGYTVFTAMEGDTALEWLVSRPNLRGVYLDLSLPGMSGADLLTHLRELRPLIPVILASGHDRSLVPEVTLRAATEFLAKPFRSSELLAAFQRVLSATI